MLFKNEINDVFRLQVGDILVIPKGSSPDARPSASQLQSKGLSVGYTCRSTNDASFIASAITNKTLNDRDQLFIVTEALRTKIEYGNAAAGKTPIASEYSIKPISVGSEEVILNTLIDSFSVDLKDAIGGSGIELTTFKSGLLSYLEDNVSDRQELKNLKVDGIPKSSYVHEDPRSIVSHCLRNSTSYKHSHRPSIHERVCDLIDERCIPSFTDDHGYRTKDLASRSLQKVTPKVVKYLHKHGWKIYRPTNSEKHALFSASMTHRVSLIENCIKNIYEKRETVKRIISEEFDEIKRIKCKWTDLTKKFKNKSKLYSDYLELIKPERS